MQNKKAFFPTFFKEHGRMWPWITFTKRILRFMAFSGAFYIKSLVMFPLIRIQPSFFLLSGSIERKFWFSEKSSDHQIDLNCKNHNRIIFWLIAKNQSILQTKSNLNTECPPLSDHLLGCQTPLCGKNPLSGRNPIRSKNSLSGQILRFLH